MRCCSSTLREFRSFSPKGKSEEGLIYLCGIIFGGGIFRLSLSALAFASGFPPWCPCCIAALTFSRMVLAYGCSSVFAGGGDGFAIMELFINLAFSSTPFFRVAASSLSLASFCFRRFSSSSWARASLVRAVASWSRMLVVRSAADAFDEEAGGEAGIDGAFGFTSRILGRTSITSSSLRRFSSRSLARRMAPRLTLGGGLSSRSLACRALRASPLRGLVRGLLTLPSVSSSRARFTPRSCWMVVILSLIHI